MARDSGLIDDLDGQRNLVLRERRLNRLSRRFQTNEIKERMWNGNEKDSRENEQKHIGRGVTLSGGGIPDRDQDKKQARQATSRINARHSWLFHGTGTLCNRTSASVRPLCPGCLISWPNRLDITARATA